MRLFFGTDILSSQYTGSHYQNGSSLKLCSPSGKNISRCSFWHLRRVISTLLSTVFTSRIAQESGKKAFLALSRCHRAIVLFRLCSFQYTSAAEPSGQFMTQVDISSLWHILSQSQHETHSCHYLERICSVL